MKMYMEYLLWVALKFLFLLREGEGHIYFIMLFVNVYLVNLKHLTTICSHPSGMRYNIGNTRKRNWKQIY